MEGFVDSGGLFAVSGHRDAAHLTYLGLHALQHRGNLGVALAVSDRHQLRSRRGVGLVQEAMQSDTLRSLPGILAAGQVWGRADLGEAMEPEAVEAERLVTARYHGGQLAVAVSGRFTNGARLRRELRNDGALFQTPSDAELLLHLLAQSAQNTFVNRLVDALWKVEGAFCLLVATEERVVAVRDRSGFRPLVMGRLGDAMLISSEDAAIRFVGGEPVRDVRPGEMIVLDGRAHQAVVPFPPGERLACVHEYVSLARVDASAFGRPCHTVRTALGARLAREHPCPEADVVMGIPGAEPMAIAYAGALGMPYVQALLREPYTARRLEEPPSGVRDFGTRVHWRPVPSAVEGKSICMVVATVVTGRAVRKAVRMLVEVGARAVHVRVASPPVRSGCLYGVSSPTTDELLATLHDGDPADWLGARSVGFLSLEGLHAEAGQDEDEPGICDACFSGLRPIEPEEPDDQLPLF